MSAISPDQSHKRSEKDGTGTLPTHGGNVPGYDLRMDFSASLNPMGMPEAVRTAAAADADNWQRYPDPYCTKLCRALAAYICRAAGNCAMPDILPEGSDMAEGKTADGSFGLKQTAGISADQIVCGNGADDLIYRITAALRPKKALVLSPTFSEYEKALRQCDCEVLHYDLNPIAQFDVDAGILNAIGDDTDMVFVCTPNNPTGRLIDPALLERIAVHCANCGAILVCDECFSGFVPGAWTYSALRLDLPHVIVLQAFTKLFAMPGLRLGFCVCGSVQTAVRIRDTGQFWSVSSPAQSAGLAALRVLEETDYLPRTLEMVSRERTFLVQSLQETGMKVISSAANFLLCHSRIPLAEPLLKEGILIRDCANFRGLSEGWYRLAVRTHAENEALVLCVRRILH